MFSFGKINEWFTKTTEKYKNKVLVFLIDQTFGNMFKNLNKDGILNDLQNGGLQLKDLEINPSHINSLLHGVPFEMTYGQIKTLNVQVPNENIFSGGLNLEASSVLLKFSLKGKSFKISSKIHFKNTLFQL